MNLKLILAFFRRAWYALDPGCEPSYAQQNAREWEAERRVRQHRPFLVDRADLFAHGLEPKRKGEVLA